MGKLIDVYCDDRMDMYEDLVNKISLYFYTVLYNNKKKIFFFVSIPPRPTNAAS